MLAEMQDPLPPGLGQPDKELGLISGNMFNGIPAMRVPTHRAGNLGITNIMGCMVHGKIAFWLLYLQ